MLLVMKFRNSAGSGQRDKRAQIEEECGLQHRCIVTTPPFYLSTCHVALFPPL